MRICEFLNEKDNGWFSTNDYICCAFKPREMPADHALSYCKGYFDECEIYKKKSPSSCFITTLVCGILGKNDDDVVMSTLRVFRDNHLQKEEGNHDLLKAYDNMGPVVAFNILHDKNKEVIADEIYNKILVPICEFIDNKEYDKAKASYYIMTLELMNKYGLIKQYNNMKANDYGYKEGEFNPCMAGHGKRLVKC